MHTQIGRGVSTVITAAVVALLLGSDRAWAQADPNPGAMTITGNVDFLNQYMFRGIRQNSTGVVIWPSFDLGIAAYSGEKGLKSLGINFGTWNSLHTGDTGVDGPSGKLWYESDFYASLGLGFGGGTSFTTTYTAYTSPNNAFSTVKEIMFKVGVDDSGKLGKFALKPYVIYAFEASERVGPAFQRLVAVLALVRPVDAVKSEVRVARRHDYGALQPRHVLDTEAGAVLSQ